MANHFAERALRNFGGNGFDIHTNDGRIRRNDDVRGQHTRHHADDVDGDLFFRSSQRLRFGVHASNIADNFVGVVYGRVKFRLVAKFYEVHDKTSGLALTKKNLRSTMRARNLNVGERKCSVMKNILLLFLSDVKTTKDGDKVVAKKTLYTNVDGEETQTTNESALRYLLQKTSLDKIFIFASKKVRGNITHFDRDTNKILPLLVDGEPQTHLDFSLARFENVDCFILDYNENNSGNENLQSVAEMARHIQKFAGDDDVTLHVDLTGGMRHVNMLMLELTRLLEYSGLKVDKVLYSNYEKGIVEEIQNVYDLFQLIAGVEEFVNFGSVKALTGKNGYYSGKKLSAPLKKLLDAMENFAAAIKLCHYGQFSESIKNLHAAIHDFDKQPSADVEYVLMSRLIGRIHAHYKDLIAFNEKDDLQVIRWCLENDYLQQALTLYTEQIPKYLGENGLIAQSAEEEKNLLELVGKDSMGRKRWFYLFSDFKLKDDLLGKGKREYCKAVKSAAKKIVKEKTFDVDEWLQSLNEKLAPLNLHCTDDKNFRAQFETLVEIFNDPSTLKELSSAKLDPIRPIVVALSAKFEPTTKGFERRKILAYFLSNTLSDDNVTEYFISNGFMKLMREYPHATKMYELLVEKIFSVNIETEKFLSIADKYFRIKIERNHSNHAHEELGEFKTADELRNFMSRALEEIEKNLPTK